MIYRTYIIGDDYISPFLLGHQPAIFKSFPGRSCALSFAPCLGKQFALPIELFGWKLNPSHQSRSAEQYMAQSASEATSL